MPITTRVQTLWDRLRRLVPPPVSTSGTAYTKSRLGAALLGAVDLVDGVTPVPSQDQQATYAENQLFFPAVLGRVDATPTDWNTDHAIQWRFAPTLQTGAADFFLDAWGGTLTVPREPGETDSPYAQRVLREIIRPVTTNVGMAQAIDQGLGIVGTVVSEAATFYTIYRLNESWRLNMGIQLNNAGNITDTPYCCFVVLLPSNPPAPYTFDTVSRIANRCKAAGTRLIQVLLTQKVTIFAPATCALADTNTAFASGPVGSTWVWSITNGTILSGGTTNTITYKATAPGNVSLVATATPPVGPVLYGNAVTIAYSIPDATIMVPDYVFAGTFDVPASLASPVPGETYLWSGTGIEIDGPTNLPTFSFDAGQAGLAAVQCIVSTVGGINTGVAYVKVVPYSSPDSHTTATIAPATDNTNGYEDFTLDLGWQYQLQNMQTNYPAIIRVYETAAARTADAGRALTASPSTDPTLQTGIVFEGQTNDSLLSFALEHQVVGTNGDTPTRTKLAYCRLYNMDSVARAITVTLTRAELQIGPTF